MSRLENTIVLDVSPGEVRGALYESDLLVEFFLHREAAPQWQDAICLGRVIEHHKSLGMAIIDMGPAGTGFFQPQQAKNLPPIGKKLLVQIMAERNLAAHHTMHRLTLSPSLSTGVAVFTPGREELRFGSKTPGKLSEEAEALRKERLHCAQALGFGGILRTKSLDLTLPTLERALKSLQETWVNVLENFKASDTPGPLYRSDPLRRWLEKYAAPVFVNQSGWHQKILPWYKEMDLGHEVIYRPEPTLFEEDLEETWQTLFDRTLPLSKGGNITIENTSIGTVIDVNSEGVMVSNHDQDIHHLNINLLAAEIVAEQLRLRNIKGQILIDFISLRKPSLRKQLEQRLKVLLKKDPSPTHLHQISPLGIAEITRESFGIPFMAALTQPGYPQRTMMTIGYELLRALQKATLRRPFELALHPRVFQFLKENLEKNLKELNLPPYTVKEEASFSLHQFTITPMRS